MKGPWMGLLDAAKYVGATPRGFDVFVRRHRVPFVAYGRHRKFSAETLDRFMEMLKDSREQTHRPRLVRAAGESR